MPIGFEKRLERRSAILIAARRLLARHGFEGVTMRDLARESGVTVPTLYNIFANKEAVIAEAIEELVRLQLSMASRHGSARGLERIVRTLEMHIAIMDETPAYSRAVLKYVANKPLVTQRVAAGLVNESLSLALHELREDGHLESGIALDAVRVSLIVTLSGAVRAWEVEMLTMEECRRAMKLSTFLTLQSVTVGGLHDELASLSCALASTWEQSTPLDGGRSEFAAK